ncbi:FAD:protein FMN transferase [Albibacterium bauzanense]|uniref:FAD:protein FMN transferase n=1 Tax=Albibacterium bauzanense TaxID=653929 RepID=A0A4R1LV68_9SPHI|nr:FAD:protein FMN transferase [Albibacterium bauzanense]TCK82657.1 thiamine biosynthesis lipoprotein [Albibacterium bauzanense]
MGFWSFQDPEQVHYTFNGQAQGTNYLISYYHNSEKVSQGQIDSILLVIDNSMSLYKSNSLISTINESAQGGELDFHFLQVIKKAFQINKETDGIFDVTVAPLVAAWGFSSEKIRKLPDSNQIAQILPFVGMENIELNGNYLKKLKPEVKIDLNGIAQGYTVDVIADFLTQNGIKNFLVEIGGELRVEGKKPDGEDFHIGIEGPVNSINNESTIKHVAIIKGKALTTSGSYQKYIQYGKDRLTHIINPKTGYPVHSEILSVTVLAKGALSADGYDNALLAMGIKNAFSFLDQYPDLEAYFVYKNEQGSIVDTMSNGFKSILKN